MQKQVTMKEIARQLGVAVSTVGRALADQPDISENTKTRVRALASKLGYIRHSGADLMRTGRSWLIVLIVPDIENAFMADCAAAISTCCEASGYQVVLALSHGDPERELYHMRTMREARAAGLIIVLSAAPQPETLALISQVPTVQLIHHHPAIDHAWFGIDDRQGFFDATRHLLSLGHREIAYIGLPDILAPGNAQLDGFKSAFDEIGLEWPHHLVKTIPEDIVQAKVATAEILNSHQPTAIVGGNPNITIGVLHEINDRGIVLPDDLSVIGYGDSPWLHGWGRGVSAMSLPAYKLSFAGCTYLLRMIEQNLRAQTTRVLPRYKVMHGPTLISRCSTSEPHQ